MSVPLIPDLSVTAGDAMSVSQIPDFSVTVGDCQAKAILEWRGLNFPFWAVQVSSRGIFRPAIEMDLEQARAVAAAVAEFDKRVAAEAAGAESQRLG